MNHIGIMEKVIRGRNADLFIESLGINFSEDKKETFKKVLIDFQEFLDKKNAELDEDTE